MVAEASSAAAAAGVQLRRWYQTSGAGSPAAADGSSYSGLCHTHEYFTSLFSVFNLKSLDHNLSRKTSVPTEMGKRGATLYHSCSVGRKCFAFLEGGGWIFQLRLHALNLCGCNSSPHEWFLTLKLIDVVPLRGWFGILYFNEVKKTWKFEFSSERQHHLTLSCSRGVFPLLQSQPFYIQVAPCLAEIGSPGLPHTV